MKLINLNLSNNNLNPPYVYLNVGYKFEYIDMSFNSGYKGLDGIRA